MTHGTVDDEHRFCYDNELSRLNKQRTLHPKTELEHTEKYNPIIEHVAEVYPVQTIISQHKCDIPRISATMLMLLTVVILVKHDY